MKNFVVLFLSLCTYPFAFTQSIGVGTNTPDASAVLDVSSTTQGMLVPRMTSAQRTAITSPAMGLLVFDTNTNTFWFKGGTTWVELIDSSNTVVHQMDGNIYMGMNGNVGIGTTQPVSKLEVKTSADSPGITLSDASKSLTATIESSKVSLGTTTNHSLLLFANSLSNHLTLSPEGKVGINTTTPEATLQVNTVPDQEAIKLKDDLKELLMKTDQSKVTIGTTTNHPLQLNANNTANQLTLSPQGDVGIGTDAPASKLEVATSTDGNGIKLTDSQDVLMMKMKSTAADISTMTNKALHLNANGGTNQLTISPLGNIGIGKVGLKKLDVEGEAHISQKLGIANLNPTSPLTFASAIGDKISLNGAAGNHFGIGLAAAQMRIHADAITSSIAFGRGSSTAFTELMRLTGAGFLGIGVASPNAPLQLANTVANRKIILWENGNNDHQYFGFGINPSMLRYQAQGDHAFFNGINSTTSNELMRITSAGRVGVGVTSPNATMEIARGTAANGTLQIKGTTYDSHFNFGTPEDTYIRGGKADSKVIINDTGTGNVGIGTTNPLQRLHVAGGTTISGDVGIGVTSPGATLEIERGTAPFGTMQVNGTTHDSHFNYGTPEDTYIRGGKEGAKVIINELGGLGNVGIGTASPSQKLDVAGNAVVSDKLGIGVTTPNAPLQFSNALQNRKIVLYEGTNNDNQFFGLGVNGSTLRYQVNGTSSNHVFYAGATAETSNELMRIEGNGNVDVTGDLKIGYEVVVSSTNVAGGQTGFNHTCDCPGDLKVLGGGWWGANLDTYGSRPTDSGSGWTVTSNNLLPFNTVTLWVYAVCARLGN